MQRSVKRKIRERERRRRERESSVNAERVKDTKREENAKIKLRSIVESVTCNIAGIGNKLR